MNHSNNISDLVQKMFEEWLWNNHYWFQLITTIVAGIILVSIVSSCILAIWYSWWWKMLIATIGVLILFKLVHRAMIGYYVIQFKKS